MGKSQSEQNTKKRTGKIKSEIKIFHTNKEVTTLVIYIMAK